MGPGRRGEGSRFMGAGSAAATTTPEARAGTGRDSGDLTEGETSFTMRNSGLVS